MQKLTNARSAHENEISFAENDKTKSHEPGSSRTDLTACIKSQTKLGVLGSQEPQRKGSSPEANADQNNELITWLQMLLEAEHAGALIMVDSLKEAHSADLAHKLEELHLSEAESCQRLRRCLKRLGAIPSRKTGDFHNKAMAVEDIHERLTFIARGQRWVAKRLLERLPTIQDPWLHDELSAVLKLHQ